LRLGSCKLPITCHGSIIVGYCLRKFWNLIVEKNVIAHIFTLAQAWSHSTVYFQLKGTQ
jgi:hypothetical protein